MDCYILHTILLVSILLFLIVIICFCYYRTKNIKNWKNNELKRLGIKNRTCYFYDIIKIEDFDFNMTLLEEKSIENILIYDVLYKNLIGAKRSYIVFNKKPLYILFNNKDKFTRDYSGIKYLVLFDYAKVKIDSNDDLDLEKNLALRNTIMIVKSMFD